ncbi:Coiled-coil domain-containing protein 12 [Perkinsus olseni]|uniref:Conserved oligomeric Golgi complex subunit 7 n=1 Tax=Perkinsus olseni TaxID=32597 RepID=A0A7J6M8K2_PEROL|nr:Coiled-coil domain-containing protein 12 [Perkinsus olseni]
MATPVRPSPPSRDDVLKELSSSLSEHGTSAADFDPVEWLMKELRKAAKEGTSIDAALPRLNSNLNALAQETSAMVDSQSSQLMSSMPTVVHDLECMKRDVATGEEKLTRLLGELGSKDKEEQRQTQLFIAKVDSGKEKLQAARTALGEANNWDKRIQELDSLLHSGEFTEFKGKMSEVKEALNGGLKMLPDYDDRWQQIEAMEMSLHREVRRKVGSAIDRCNPKQLRVCYDAYQDNSGDNSGLEEFDDAVCTAMNTVIQRKWTASLQSSSSSSSATTSSEGEGVDEVLSESEEEGGVRDNDGVIGFFHALAEALQERLETLAAVTADGDGLLMRKCIYSAMKELFGPWAPSCKSLPDHPKQFLYSLMRGFNHLERKMHFEDDEWSQICEQKLIDGKLLESLVPGLFLPSEAEAGGGLGNPLSSEEEIEEEEEQRRSRLSLADGLISLETRVMKYQTAIVRSGAAEMDASLPAAALAPLWMGEVHKLYDSYWYTTVNRSISSMVSRVFKAYSAQGDYNADFSSLLANCRSIHQSVGSLRVGAEEFSSQLVTIARKASEKARESENEDASIVAILACIGPLRDDEDDRQVASVDEVCQRVDRLIIEGLCSPITKRILKGYGTQSVWSGKGVRGAQGGVAAVAASIMPSTAVTSLSEYLFLFVPYLSKESSNGSADNGDDVLRSQWVPAVFQRAAQTIITEIDGITTITPPGLKQLNTDLSYSLKIILSLWNGCRPEEELPEADSMKKWIHATEILMDTSSSSAAVEQAKDDPIVMKLSKAVEAAQAAQPSGATKSARSS